jgi:hypothetical protein
VRPNLPGDQCSGRPDVELFESSKIVEFGMAELDIACPTSSLADLSDRAVSLTTISCAQKAERARTTIARAAMKVNKCFIMMLAPVHWSMMTLIGLQLTAIHGARQM